MKTAYPYIIIFGILFISCCSNKHRYLSEFDPIVISNSEPELLQYWEFSNDEYLWRNNTGEVNELDLYKDSLRHALGADKYSEAIQKEGEVDVNYITENDYPAGDQKNAVLVHHGTLGELRNINFIEAQLLNYQLTKYPLLSHPTEFAAYIAIHDANNLVRVYFCSSDTPWPPKHQAIFSALQKDLNHGWKLKYALHNHYESKDNNYIGILAPSMSDAQFFKMLKENYNLETAIITNGFHTVMIDNDDFENLESH